MTDRTLRVCIINKHVGERVCPLQIKRPGFLECVFGNVRNVSVAEPPLMYHILTNHTHPARSLKNHFGRKNTVFADDEIVEIPNNHVTYIPAQ